MRAFPRLNSGDRGGGEEVSRSSSKSAMASVAAARNHQAVGYEARQSSRAVRNRDPSATPHEPELRAVLSGCTVESYGSTAEDQFVHVTVRNSDVWNMFRDSKDEKGKALCVICYNTYAKSKSSTSALRTHAMRQHPSAWSDATGEEKVKLPYSHNWLAMEQQLLCTGARSPLALRQCIGRFVVQSGMSFNCVISRWFRDLVYMSGWQQAIPCGETVRNEVMTDLVKTRSAIYELLTGVCNQSKVSLTVDTCDGPNRHDFIGVTAHWIDNHWEPQWVTLAVDYLAENGHSADVVADTLRQRMEWMGVDARRVQAVTSDNAPEMVAGVQQVKETLGLPTLEHVRCASHSQQIAARAILNVAGVLKATNKLRKQLRAIVCTARRKQRFRRECYVAGLPPPRLIADGVTRWHSGWRLCRDMLMVRGAVAGWNRRNLNRKMRQQLTWTVEEWAVIQDVHDLLAPFARVSLEGQFDKRPTMNHAAQNYDFLIRSCEYLTVPDYMQAGFEKMKRMLAKYEGLQGDMYLIPIALDPTTKLTGVNLNFQRTAASHAQVRDKVGLALAEYWEGESVLAWGPPSAADSALASAGSGGSVVTSEGEGSHATEELQLFNPPRTLLQMATMRPCRYRAQHRAPLDTIEVNSLNQVTTGYTRRGRVPIPNELANYLASPTAAAHTEPLLWWKKNGHQWPNVARAARDYLAVQATSAPIERVWSHMRQQVSEFRHQLEPETIRALLLLKSWYQHRVVSG
mgnify:CR=1 FL=1